MDEHPAEPRCKVFLFFLNSEHSKSSLIFSAIKQRDDRIDVWIRNDLRRGLGFAVWKPRPLSSHAFSHALEWTHGMLSLSVTVGVRSRNSVYQCRFDFVEIGTMPLLRMALKNNERKTMKNLILYILFPRHYCRFV